MRKAEDRMFRQSVTHTKPEDQIFKPLNEFLKRNHELHCLLKFTKHSSTSTPLLLANLYPPSKNFKVVFGTWICGFMVGRERVKENKLT